MLEDYVSYIREDFEKKAKTKEAYSKEEKDVSKFLIKSKLVEVIRHKDEKLYCELKKHDLIFSSENENYLSKYDQKILDCYELYRTGSNLRVINDNMDLHNISTLESFIKTLKEEFENNIFSQYQVELICFLWMNVLSNYLESITDLLYYKEHNASDEIVKQKYSYISHLDREGISFHHDRCVNMIKWAVSNGLHWVIDYKTIDSITMSLFRHLSKNKKVVKILLETQIAQIAKTAKINDDGKLMSVHSVMIYVSELTDSEEDFIKCLEAASKYTALPLFVMLWDDVGFLTKSPLSIRDSALLNPERAISCLIKLKQNSEQLEQMKYGMDFLYNHYKKNNYIKESISTLQWKGRIALYFFLVSDWERGRYILESTNFNYPVFYHALCSMASEQFKLALSFLNKMEKEKNFNTKLKFIVNPLKGILMEKIAEKMDADTLEKNIYLENAISCLNDSATTRKELLRPISRIQEKLGRYSDAYNSLAILETNLKTFQISSAENCLLNSVQEHMEQLAALHPECLNEISASKISRERKNKKQNKSSKNRHENTVKDSQRPIKSVNDAAPTQSVDSLKRDESVSLDTNINININTNSMGMNKSEPIDTIMLEETKIVKCLEVGEKKYDKELWRIVCDQAVLNRRSWACLTDDIIEHAMNETKNDRRKLTDELFISSSIDYTALLNQHDDLIKQYTNPIVKMVIIQNKAWSLRDKSFNRYALTLESKITKVSIENLKIKIRKQILCMIYSSIERITNIWELDGLPDDWKDNPDLIIS